LQFCQSFTVLPDGNERQRRRRDPARQQLFTGTERDRTHLNDKLVEKPCIVELADKFAAAD
jgi:hypothetical protein